MDTKSNTFWVENQDFGEFIPELETSGRGLSYGSGCEESFAQIWFEILDGVGGGGFSDGSQYFFEKTLLDGFETATKM